MTPAAVEKCSAQLSTAAAHYETLRRAALGEPLPPEARNGLSLFLRRGMWGWAQTMAAASARPASSPAPPSDPTASCRQSPLVHVFAAMAMDTNDRRERDERLP